MSGTQGEARSQTNKVGRNEPCPCGSGKKFKRCHLFYVPPTPEVWKQAELHAARYRRMEQERIAQFGAVRTPVSAVQGGKRFIAVGNAVFWGKWRFFLDFLDPFVRGIFGQEWGKAQLESPEPESHPLMEWRIKALNFMNAVTPNAQGNYTAIPNGFVAAFFNFAYDLYVVADNNRLDGALLARLKHAEQFQGARHELFAEATCLRAGFAIEHEDESNPRSHVEFVATHKKSGQKFSVEAKSKHRPGVLGRKGPPELPDRPNFRFGSLLNSAAQKQNLHPLVVFVDTNLSFAHADRFFQPQSTNPFLPSRSMGKILDIVRGQNRGRDPYELIIFTNHPHHYGEEDKASPGRHLLAVLSKYPAPAVELLSPLSDICRAAALFGNIPTEFPSGPI